jgi:predicted Zn finger-like uncharacterized protein
MAMSRCSYCGSVQGATNSRGDWVCYACGKTTLANFSGKTGAADAITCNCPHCGTAFRVGASLQGKSVRCKKCGAGFVVSATPATSPSAGDLPPTIAVSLPNRQAAGGSAGVPPAVPPSPAVSPGPVAAPGYYPAGGASLPPVMPPPPPIPTHSRDWRTIIAVAVGSGLALVALVAIIMTFILMRQPGPSSAAGRTGGQQESNPPGPVQQNPSREQNKPPAAPAKPPASSDASTPPGNREPPSAPQPAPTKPANPSDKPQPPQDKPPPRTESAEPKPKALKDLFQELAPSVPLILVRVDEKRAGSGSGFLVEHNGQWYVATNNHVIENAAAGLAVLFLDTKGKPIVTARSPEVRIVRMSKEADVALLDCDAIREKLRENNIRPVRLAPANYQPPQGEKVFAIGHPGAGASGDVLPLTLTEGIISGVGREFQDLKPMKFLQTTASVNPGNSGGPLFDYDGQVVGINTLVIRRSGMRDVNLEGLNFALEIRHLHDLLNRPELSHTPEEIEEMLKRRTRPRLAKPPAIRPDARIIVDRQLTIPPFLQQQLTVKLAKGEICLVAAVPFPANEVRIEVLDPRNNRVIRDVQTRDNPPLIFPVEVDGTYRLWVANPNFVPVEVQLKIGTVRPPPE